RGIRARAADPREVVGVAVLERAFAACRVLRRGSHEEAVEAPVDAAADDAVHRARAEREIVPVDAALLASRGILRTVVVRGVGGTAAPERRTRGSRGELLAEERRIPRGQLQATEEGEQEHAAVGDAVEHQEVADQREVARADRIAVLQLTLLQAAERAHDERDVHLDADALVELVSKEELRDHAVETLPERRDLLAVHPLDGGVAPLPAHAGTEAGTTLRDLGGGVDRAHVARDRPGGSGEQDAKDDARCRRETSG